MRVIVTTIFVLACASVLPNFAQAKKKIYLSGKLISIEPIQASLPVMLGSEQSTNVPVPVGYELEVGQDDLAYVGSCQIKDYRAELRVGDEIQFRLGDDKIYLKRQNGKELVLDFVLQARLGPDGKPVTVIRRGKHKR